MNKLAASADCKIQYKGISVSIPGLSLPMESIIFGSQFDTSHFLRMKVMYSFQRALCYQKAPKVQHPATLIQTDLPNFPKQIKNNKCKLKNTKSQPNQENFRQTKKNSEKTIIQKHHIETNQKKKRILCNLEVTSEHLKMSSTAAECSSFPDLLWLKNKH